MKLCVVRLSGAFLFYFAAYCGSSATTNLVTMGDFFFSPKNLTVTNGDTVQWRNSGSFSHDTTSSNTPPVWQSSLLGNGGTFSFKFMASGLYPYHCQFHQSSHPEQNATVNVVAGPNVLPTVTITNPLNNATFTAPATFPIQARASDSDGTIAQVQFFSGTTSLGIDTTSPYSVTASNVAAGTYTISAVATDNSGGKATNSITVVVKSPPDAVTLLSPALNGDVFTFSFMSQSGYTYSIEYRTTLDSAPQTLMTTNGTGGVIAVSDTNTNSQRFYQVGAH